jgi:transcriptional accessory protein Tex/SPT6
VANCGLDQVFISFHAGRRIVDKILLQIAAELSCRPGQVEVAVGLLDGGATVPFIARYRKEATDGLDDVQLRELETRLGYLRELEERRSAVVKSIEEQGKLTPELRAAIGEAATKQVLEDLYLPYKPRRRTKGMIAREAGLEPLAERLFADPSLDPLALAPDFVNPEVGRGLPRPAQRALGGGRSAGGQAARVVVARRGAARQTDGRQRRKPRRRVQVP